MPSKRVGQRMHCLVTLLVLVDFLGFLLDENCASGVKLIFAGVLGGREMHPWDKERLRGSSRPPASASVLTCSSLLPISNQHFCLRPESAKNAKKSPNIIKVSSKNTARKITPSNQR